MLSQEIAWFDDSKNSVGVLTTKLAVEVVTLLFISFIIVALFAFYFI